MEEMKRAGFDDPMVEAMVLEQYELARRAERRTPSVAKAALVALRGAVTLGVMALVAGVVLTLVAAVGWRIASWLWSAV